jgi:hydrogenase expression/formation protein HypE
MKHVVMAHGSGGLETAGLIAAIFERHLSNPILDRKEDAAVLPSTGPCVFSTDSFVVDPIRFPGGDIGRLAVCGTVNDLLCMGATPRWLSAGFILEEGLPFDVLEDIVISMKAASIEAGVVIAAADTKVVEGKGGLYLNTSGIGMLGRRKPILPDGGKPGDAVIVSGSLGDHHACILSQRLGIRNGIRSDCAVLLPLVDALRSKRVHVHAMRDITRGGLATVLNELCLASGLRCRLEEGAIPVKPEVGAFCGILGLDPMYMGNEGKVLLFVPDNECGRALRALRETELGCDAAKIGTLLASDPENPGRAAVILHTRLGGNRLVDSMSGEGLPRIC